MPAELPPEPAGVQSLALGKSTMGKVLPTLMTLPDRCWGCRTSLPAHATPHAEEGAPEQCLEQASWHAACPLACTMRLPCCSGAWALPGRWDTLSQP